MKQFVSYIRVSTQRQGESGLGQKAQIRAVNDFSTKNGGVIIAEYNEVESGKNNARPQLQAAIEHCIKEDATLLIAKLDRLARNAAFIMNLQESAVKFTACDMPEATHFVVGIMALVAQLEANAISDRTKAALESVRLNGSKSGKPIGRPKGSKNSDKQKKAVSDAQRRTVIERDAPHMPMIWDLLEEGRNNDDIAKKLNIAGKTTYHGKPFYAQLVARMIGRNERPAT